MVAAVSGAIALISLWVNGIRQERARRQRVYADALAVLVAYREFAYVIRRRRAPAPGHEEIAGAERVRISEALREVQRDIEYHCAWTKTEPAAHVATAYEALVKETRRVAGGYMHNAWEAQPVDNDAGMNIADIDYAPLAKYETAYLEAVAQALKFWRVALPWLPRPRVGS
jgi:hypothetical protein